MRKSNIQIAAFLCLCIIYYSAKFGEIFYFGYILQNLTVVHFWQFICSERFAWKLSVSILAIRDVSVNRAVSNWACYCVLYQIFCRAPNFSSHHVKRKRSKSKNNVGPAGSFCLNISGQKCKVSFQRTQRLWSGGEPGSATIRLLNATHKAPALLPADPRLHTLLAWTLCIVCLVCRPQ